MARGPKHNGSLFVNLLGGFRVAGPRDADPLSLDRKRTRALLAMLALDPAHSFLRGKLTALLWSEQSENAARHGLRQCLHDLRHTTARVNIDVMRADGDRIGLDASRLVVDVAKFEHCLERGTPEALEEAVALYQGDLLDGFHLDERAFEEWLQLERERLRSRAVDALRQLLAHHVRSKMTDTGVQIALRVLTLEPFDETVHRTLMRFYADSGRRTAALRQYEACVEVLARELGAEPEAETRELYRRLVAQREHGVTTPGARTSRKSAPRAARTPVLDDAVRSTPFIGRDAEREWLSGLREAAYGGRPQLGLVLGEAGIGKSRLVGELTSCVQDRRPLVLLGRGRDGEDILPFAPWVEALRPALSVDALGRLAQVTRQDLARLFPETADGPSVPSTGLEDGPRIFEAVAQLLRELAVRRPLIVVIEDLHWCDDMTVRLLRFLPRRLEGRPVLLLGTARHDEIPAGRNAVLNTLRQDTSCIARTLGPLARDEATQLFHAFLASRESVPAAVVAERMWRLSEGNPFVVIECARAVRDRTTATTAASFTLPDEVRGLTTRSLANLGERAARLADAAAVIGRDFDVPVLQTVAGLTQSEVADGLEELVRRRILREVGGRFDFSHDRVREVTYDRLLGPRRSLLHRQVASALETVYSGDLGPHCAAIGAHYCHAGLWSDGCDYLARAGYQAWERGAGREALACFEGALKALAQLPDTAERRELRVRLHLVANGASVAIGSYELGRNHLHEAQQLAGALGNRRWDGRIAAALSNSYRPAGQFNRARGFGQQALDIAQETDDRWLESVARLVLGEIEYTAGNYRQSVEHLAAVQSNDARAPDMTGPFFPHVDRLATMRSRAREFMVWSLTQLGEFDMAMGVVNQAFKESDVVDDPLGTFRLHAYISLGRVQYGRGLFAAAVQAYESALALYRDDCHGNTYRPLSWGLALSYALAGRVPEGVELLERAEATEREIASKAFRDCRLLHLGRVLLEAGRIDEAARIGEEALCVTREQGNPPSEAGAHALLADIAGLRDPVAHQEMERHLLTALELAEPLEMRPLAARCHQRLSWLYGRLGRHEHEHHSAAAASLLKQMGGEPLKLDAAGVF